MVIAKNEVVARGLSKEMDRATQSGRFLFHDNFEDGFCGWRDHFHGAGPAPALSLSARAAVRGSKSLMIPVTSYPTGMTSSTYMGSNTPATFKNLSRYFDENVVSFSGYVAVGMESSDALGGWFASIDTQAWNNAFRSFFKLRCHRDVAGNARGRKWQIAPSAGQWIDIPGAVSVAGDNENKYNFNYFRLTVDLAANGGLGGYVEAQINHEVFDLSGLGGGTAPEPPQQGNEWDDFNGGLNFGLSPYTGGANTGNAYILADELTAEILP